MQEDIYLHLAPSSPEQQLVTLWVGLWSGTGRAAGLLALPTLLEQLFPVSSRGKRHRARQKAPAGWVWPADPGWSLLSQPIHAVTALKIICLCKIYVCSSEWFDMGSVGITDHILTVVSATVLNICIYKSKTINMY